MPHNADHVLLYEALVEQRVQHGGREHGARRERQTKDVGNVRAALLFELFALRAGERVNVVGPAVGEERPIRAKNMIENRKINLFINTISLTGRRGSQAAGKTLSWRVPVHRH